MRISHWAGESYGIGWYGAAALWALGFAGMWYSFSGPKMVVRYVMVHWMGASFIFASATLCYELIRLFTDFDDAAAAPWLLISGSLLVLGAIIGIPSSVGEEHQNLFFQDSTVKTGGADQRCAYWLSTARVYAESCKPY